MRIVPVSNVETLARVPSDNGQIESAEYTAEIWMNANGNIFYPTDGTRIVVTFDDIRDLYDQIIDDVKVCPDVYAYVRECLGNNLNPCVVHD